LGEKLLKKQVNSGQTNQIKACTPSAQQAFKWYYCFMILPKFCCNICSFPGENPYWEKISNGESIKQHLVVMERVVTENIYQPKQAAYRGLDILLG